MQDLIMSLGIGFVFVLLAVTLVFAVYFSARKILTLGDSTHRTFDAASSVAFRISALYGLILALVYAQELDDYKDIRINLAEEAVAIADVYNDIRRYGGLDATTVQMELANYVATVVDEEWHMLGKRQGLSPKAWQSWESVYMTLLDLTPATDRQDYLANRMRNRITDVARHRQVRESAATGRFSGVFWGPAVIGLVLLAMPFYVYPPTRSNMTLLAIFGSYSGVVLFFIFIFANPFEPPGRLPPTPFIDLLDGEIGQNVLQPRSLGSNS